MNAIEYIKQGIDKVKNGKLKGAIEDFTKAIQLEPNNFNAYNNRGIAKNELKNYQGAIKDYSKAIELDPKKALAYINRGIAKNELKDYQGAIEDYSKAIELDPKDGNTYYNRGYAKNELKDYQGAIEDYSKAIELDPKNGNAYNNRGIAKRELKDYQDAIEDYSKAIELAPKDRNAYNNRGIAKKELKDYQDAIIDYSKAIELDINLAEAYYNRGSAKNEIKDYQGSIEDYSKSIELKFNLDKKREVKNKRLLKFRPININTLYLLNNKTVWFSNPNNFNDPVDGKLLQKYFYHNNSLISTLNKVTVLSFSLEEENNNSNLLWSHYSLNHKGLCLVYKQNEEINKTKENYFYEEKVKYDKEIKPNVLNFDNFIDSGFLIKDNIWQYENEFRILLFNKNNTPEQNGNEIALNEIGLQLTEIIFGVKCNEKDHELVQSIIVKNKDVYRDVRFYKMELNDPSANFFQLQKVELDNSKYHIK